MLMQAFLLLMALGCGLVTLQALRTGVVRWRNGSVAATKTDQPRAYWAFIIGYIVVTLVVAGAAMMQIPL